MGVVHRVSSMYTIWESMLLTLGTHRVSPEEPSHRLVKISYTVRGLVSYLVGFLHYLFSWHRWDILRAWLWNLLSTWWSAHLWLLRSRSHPFCFLRSHMSLLDHWSYQILIHRIPSSGLPLVFYVFLISERRLGKYPPDPPTLCHSLCRISLGSSDSVFLSSGVQGPTVLCRSQSFHILHLKLHKVLPSWYVAISH